jgi:hypothetical protein
MYTGAKNSSSLQQAANEAAESKFASKRKNSLYNNKEFLVLYKTNQLHLIQDFLFKITNLKVNKKK